MFVSIFRVIRTLSVANLPFYFTRCALVKNISCYNRVISSSTLISDEQFKLNRLANAAIDIYCMVSVLSRASRSMKRGQPSAEYEATVASVFCDEVSISQWELLRNMFLLSFNCIPARGSALIVTGNVGAAPPEMWKL